jgi:hypothetical protein
MKGYIMKFRVNTLEEFNAAIKSGSLMGKYSIKTTSIEPSLLESIVDGLYPRKCDNSGVGMWEGYHDYGIYYATKKDLLEGNQKTNPDYTIADWEAEFDEDGDSDECYWTEWSVMGDGWEDGVFKADGTKVANPFYPDSFELGD